MVLWLNSGAHHSSMCLCRKPKAGTVHLPAHHMTTWKVMGLRVKGGPWVEMGCKSPSNICFILPDISAHKGNNCLEWSLTGKSKVNINIKKGLNTSIYMVGDN